MSDAAASIRSRLERLGEIKATYLAYLQDRIVEEDWHGAWDACVNLSELSCERDGLNYALGALGEGTKDKQPGEPEVTHPERCMYSVGKIDSDGVDRGYRCVGFTGHSGKHFR